MLAKRYVFVLVLLLFAIGALSAVSANDLNATDEAICEEVGADSELKQTEDIKVQASENGTFTELNDKISSGSDIVLDKDYAYVDSDSKFHMGINITKSVSIRGNNHTIYANSARVFLIRENSQVSIYDLHFVNKMGNNGVAYSRGGTILNHGNLTLVDCSFEKSYAATLGGAIHSDNILVLQSCEFNSNVASNVNESQEPSGGAVSSLKIFVAYDCTFNFNRADFGGAIYNEKVALISKSHFFYNEAKVSGGAIYNFDNCHCQVNSSSLYFNDAEWGGALYNCEANNCIFLGNSATKEGNNMNEGKMYNCTYPEQDNDYVDVDGVFRLSASQKTIAYGSAAKYDVKLINHLNKAVSGVNVKLIAVNGNTQKTFYAKTNAKGIASFSINLAPKSYSLSISSNDDRYVAALKSSKLIINKASSKITAKNAKFKVKKTKKYSITLKDGNGKAIKSVKVTISVGGKKYTATTNAKGKATFKLSKLKKKGNLKATVKFTGNSYYNGASKKVKINVKK